MADMFSNTLCKAQTLCNVAFDRLPDELAADNDEEAWAGVCAVRRVVEISCWTVDPCNRWTLTTPGAGVLFAVTTEVKNARLRLGWS